MRPDREAVRFDALVRTLGYGAAEAFIVAAELLRRLAEHGCDEAQGYAIAHPLDAAAAGAWLSAADQREKSST